MAIRRDDKLTPLIDLCLVIQSCVILNEKTNWNTEQHVTNTQQKCVWTLSTQQHPPPRCHMRVSLPAHASLFPQKNATISVSFAENDLQLKTSPTTASPQASLVSHPRESLSAKKKIQFGALWQKMTYNSRHPVGLRHPVPRESLSTKKNL